MHVCNVAGLDFWVTGAGHQLLTSDIPVPAWIVPPVKDNQGNCTVATEVRRMVVDSVSWKLHPIEQPTLKRARSDTSSLQLRSSLVVEINVTFLRPMTKHVSTCLLLAVGATQLGTKKTDAAGSCTAFARRIAELNESSASSDDKNKNKGTTGSAAQSAASASKDSKHIMG